MRKVELPAAARELIEGRLGPPMLEFVRAHVGGYESVAVAERERRHHCLFDA
ncbi:MAG: hypothetical protein Q7S95_03085 [bacterium]|nr:hypothetical protein [bacterium]